MYVFAGLAKIVRAAQREGKRLAGLKGKVSASEFQQCESHKVKLIAQDPTGKVCRNYMMSKHIGAMMYMNNFNTNPGGETPRTMARGAVEVLQATQAKTEQRNVLELRKLHTQRDE
jgi:hypothetical protein